MLDQTADPLVGQLMDALDWERTPLGRRDQWPPALTFAVELCQASGLPMLIWWGPEAIQIYNDAFIEILGNRHPAALGERGEDCWPEAWDIVGPILERTRRTGVPFTAYDMHFTLERNGFPEETYFTLSIAESVTAA